MKKNEKIIGARSKQNGIIFYSNIFSCLGIETFYDDSGNIQSKLINTNLDEFIESLQTLNEKESKLFNMRNVILFDILLIFFSIIAFVFSNNFGLILAAINFSVFVSFDLLKIASSSYMMKSKNGIYRSLARFHSAEHMVINAYEKLKHVPNLEEIKKFSRFSKHCGSVKIFSRLFIYSMLTLAVATLCSYSSLLYLIACLFILIFTIFAIKYGWLNFFQILVTNKPTDRELELAIEGLRHYEIMEEMIKNDKELCGMIKSVSDCPDYSIFIFH